MSFTIERNRAVLALRGPKAEVSPDRPYAWLVEPEYSARGRLEDVATIFLTNRECPLRCVMCDLWKHTLDEPTPPGAIPRQIEWALAQLPMATQLKLYNSGNFFDPMAIPVVDHPAIAHLVQNFENVIVESHPLFVTDRVLEFQQLLQTATLEVAMGLETAHPAVLAKLNKQMTLGDFRAAADRLAEWGVALRVFILLQPPYLAADDALPWAERSLKFAFDCGATVCSLIPTRAGNGWMEHLAQQGDYQPPTLALMETALVRGLQLGRGRVQMDLWDAQRFAGDDPNANERIARIEQMNRTQHVVMPG